MSIFTPDIEEFDLYHIFIENMLHPAQINQMVYNEKGEAVDCWLLDINHAIEEKFELKKENIIGRRAKDVFDDLEPELFIKCDEAIKTSKSSSFEIYNRLREKYFTVLVIPLDNQDKFGVMYQDITELHNKKTELRESEQNALNLVSKLEKADKNKNEFINVLSHELRNPLATITGGIELLKLKLTNGNEELLSVLNILGRQTKHLTKLVDDMLDITRISQKKIILKKENFILNTIVKDSIEDTRSQFKGKGIKLLEYICSDQIFVYADSLRITQCLTNILGNALKFTQEYGTVSISLKAEDGNAIISVEDNGIGINQDKLTTIFEPFKQDYNKFSFYNNMGLGLGLPIVKEYIEIHGGDVYAYSPGIGKGSTFTLRLPINNLKPHHS